MTYNLLTHQPQLKPLKLKKAIYILIKSEITTKFINSPLKRESLAAFSRPFPPPTNVRADCLI